MLDNTYRVIQWMTGDVGRVGIRHFADNPVFDLVGVVVDTPEKVGKDAGEIAGIAPIGVVAPDGPMAHPGYDWTAMGAINAIPDVCDAAPGWITHFDLGLVRPRGLVRK